MNKFEAWFWTIVRLSDHPRDSDVHLAAGVPMLDRVAARVRADVDVHINAATRAVGCGQRDPATLARFGGFF